MDILIGIALAALLIAVLLTAFVWIGDHYKAIRESTPGVRAVLTLLWVVLSVLFAIDLAREVGDRFGWRDEPADEATCSVTRVYDDSDKLAETRTTCTS